MEQVHRAGGSEISGEVDAESCGMSLRGSWRGWMMRYERIRARRYGKLYDPIPVECTWVVSNILSNTDATDTV